LRLYRGWSALVGKSGAGKTTLARLIAEQCCLLVHFVEQRADNPPQTLRDFLEASDKEAFLLKRDLKIREDCLERWEKLSYGERKRTGMRPLLCFLPISTNRNSFNVSRRPL
jgi:ABC-type phosphate/phosphonate transport system ATPase subunit